MLKCQLFVLTEIHMDLSFSQAGAPILLPMSVAVIGHSYDFVVWAPSGDIHIQKLTADYQFLKPRLKKAEKFFQPAIIPELLG